MDSISLDDLERYLVEIYRIDLDHACFVAEFCDEYLDRSGAMLGRVRAEARRDT